MEGAGVSMVALLKGRGSRRRRPRLGAGSRREGGGGGGGLLVETWWVVSFDGFEEVLVVLRSVDFDGPGDVLPASSSPVRGLL